MPCFYSLLVLVPLNRLDIGFSENSALIMSDDDTNDGDDDDDDDEVDDDTNDGVDDDDDDEDDDDTNDGVDDNEEEDNDDTNDGDDDDEEEDNDDEADDDHDDEVDIMMAMIVMMTMVANMPWVDTSTAHHNTLRWTDRYLQAANMRSKSISVKWWSIDMSSRMSTISLVRRDRT